VIDVGCIRVKNVIYLLYSFSSFSFHMVTKSNTASDVSCYCGALQ